MPLDYSGQNLRGRSFKGRDLTGANFSHADIRGADFSKADIRGANFSNAIVTGANFRDAKAGADEAWIAYLTVFIFQLLVFTLGASFTLSLFVAQIFDIKNPRNLLTGVIFLLFTLVFFTLSIRKNLLESFFVLIFAYTFIPILIFQISALFFPKIFTNINTSFTSIGIALIFTFPFIIFGIYIYWSYRNINEKDDWLELAATNLVTVRGTNFYHADLTDVDFTATTLKNTNFSYANLTHTRFYKAKGLEYARVDGTILTNRNVLNLLVTGNGKKELYIGVNLKGANLKGANLIKANFREADIRDCLFEEACLEWANLTLAQAVGTNFTNAYMTGICIEAWNINNTTKLDNVDCRFVYLLENPKPETDDRERRPPGNLEFQPGEFTKLFEEVFNTIDLIFRDGIDWKAFVTAFKKVQVENEDTELTIQSIENKGDGVVVVKVAVPTDANKEKIHSDFNQNYQLALKAVEEKYKAQLQAKDEQIVIYRQQSAEMKDIISLLANKPVNIYNTQENQNMTNSNDSSRKIEIGTVGRDFNASGQALNLGEIDISGTVTNIINQLPDSPEPENPGIKELLKQLEEAIKAETNLSEEDKNEALEQLKTLAEAGQNPKEGTLQKAAKTAIKILKGTISSLPSAATLVETCSKILPLISQYLGLG